MTAIDPKLIRDWLEAAEKAKGEVWEAGYGNGVTGPRAAPSLFWADEKRIHDVPVRRGNQVVCWLVESNGKRKELEQDATFIAQSRSMPAQFLAVLEIALAMREALKLIAGDCADGIVVCTRCGHEETMSDLDLHEWAKAALAQSAALQELTP